MTKNDVTDDATRVGNRRHCACSCGAYTNSPRSTYLPGHDARHAGAVARLIFDNSNKSTYGSTELAYLKLLPTVALKAKAAKQADAMLAKANAATTKPSVRQIADAANDVNPALQQSARRRLMADGTVKAVVSGVCKVGRWEYDAEMVPGAYSLRFKSKQGVWVGSTNSNVIKSFVPTKSA
jgi:hypothetical protein